MRYLLILALVALPSTVAAQTATVTGEVMTIYRQGQTTPAVAPVTLPRANRVCAQTPVSVSGTVANPRVAAWPDPANGALECVWTDPGTGVLAMMAVDAAVVYEATLRLVTAAGQSPESPRSNLFTKPGTLAAAPAQFRVRP